MQLGKFNRVEPNGTKYIKPSEIELAIIPGIAFDKQNNRLGRGKGFYDRIMNKITAPKIGVCFTPQYLKEISTETFDKKVDMVITG